MNKTQLIDDYTFNRLNAEEQLLFEAKTLIDPELNETLKWQGFTYEVVKSYGRKELKKEIIAAEQKLFSEPRFKNFRAIVSGIFK